MTTQELKSYIDRMLGNSIRLLLPSYWWKKAFGAVVDNMVTEDGIKTINGESVIGEGDLRVGVKNVESVEALEKLEAELGDIATIGYDNLKSINISQCPLAEELDVIGAWDNLTHVNKIEQGVPYNNGSDYLGIYFSTKSEFGTDVIIVGSSEGKCGYYYWYNNSDERVITLEETNKLLKEKEYRVVSYNINIDGSIIDQTFKLYAGFTTADAYIKGDSWERLAKESDVDAKIIFVDIYNNKANEDNAKAFSIIKDCVLNGKPYVVVGGTSRLLFVSDGVMFVEGMSEEDICNLSFRGFGYNETIDGTTTRKHYTATLYADGHVVLGTAKDFAIDSKLSDTSENAVQNKVITAAINDLNTRLAALEAAIANL